jgi:hypothetical protein
MAHPNFSDNSTTEEAPKLLGMVRDKLRLKHYSLRTEQAYVDWIKRYILFHGKSVGRTACCTSLAKLVAIEWRRSLEADREALK